MASGDGKKNSRRFLDTLTSRTSSNASEHSRVRPLPSKPPTLRQIIDDEKSMVAEASDSPQTWTGVDLVESPRENDEDSGSLRASSPAPEPRRKPVPLKFTHPTTADVPPVPSLAQARWERLRQHVLPIPIRGATPPPPAPAGAAQTLPARSQTPKPSRLARLGFRQVVDYAREVDGTRKFARELEKVCWSTRFAEPQRVKLDVTPAGSTLQLAFMSNTSLATTGTSSADNPVYGHKKSELRRPQSVQSLTTTYRSVPSVKQLYQTLLHYATPSGDSKALPSSLPQESLVLSTLLIPFLTSENGSQFDEERWSAIEAFEVITRSWAPLNEGMGVERYLWCCKAAFVPPSSMRTRILSILWGLLIPTETNYSVSTSECFQTLAQGLFSLLPNLRPLSNSVSAQEEMLLLSDMISKVRSGCCGELETTFVQEEYDAVASAKDDKNLVREAILLEALSRCLEDCTDDSRVWLFQSVLEQYWITSPKEVQFTPLLCTIYARTLYGLSRALLSLLSVPLDQAAAIFRAQCTSRVLQERFIPDMDALGDAVKPEARINIVNAVLELICMDRAKEPMRWGLSLVNQWFRGLSVWKSCLDKTLLDLISKGNWSNTVVKLAALIRLLPDEIRKQMVAFVLPHLYDKLVEEPPPYPCIPLTNLLDTIARSYPQVFYKPLFLCAASSKEFTVVNHLCVIVVVAKFLPDYWIRDAEMMSVALMSDGGKKGQTSETGSKTWMKARLGQAVVMLELIGCIQAARHAKQSSSNSDSLVGETVKCAAGLESRLGILLKARERTAPMAPSQRLLFCVLFREMRLLTRSLKPATWLVRIVDWYIDISTDEGIGQDPEEEEKSTIGQIQGLYAAAQDGVRSTHHRRSTMLLSRSLQKSHSTDDSIPANTSADLAAMFVHKETLLTSLSKGFVAKAMKLLVTMSTLLTSDEYQRLAPFLWYQLQSDGDSSLTSAVCFLIMQCAEKTPTDLVARIEVDLQSSDHDTKLNAVYKIGILFNWRYQILQQHVVADRARRPFKLARGPIAFIATDIGSSSYIREDDVDELKDSLPSELKKRLAEIGWEQDDAPVDQHREWVKTPISLLSTQQVDRLDNPEPDLPHPSSPSALNLGSLTSLPEDKVDEVGLLRRNSSTGGPQPGGKRRAVFVPSLALIFPRLASLIFDTNLAVSAAARHTMVDIMRNDPTLLSRPVLDLFAGEQKDIQSAILTINAFFHVQGTLPYPMTHFLFNNVAGFLKWTTRQPEERDALEDFAHALPVLSRLTPQVSSLSIRDIRRAKIEAFLIPSGSLWFPSSAPLGPMFPRSLGPRSNPFDDLPSDLVSIMMIRVSQNMLLLSMLKRNRHDVQLVRKNLSRLELPSTASSKQSPLELSDFVPRRRQKKEGSPSLTGLSLMLSRSYVLLVAQIFRSMSRHLNDRNELAVLVDGLNQILLAHGDDIGVVGQVMIALMAASTRFRRLFTSGGGYALFMPAVLKVYTESQPNQGIKLAIEYAANRFYALHEEAFVFQTLDILAHITALPHIEANWLVKSIYNLFLALQKGVSPSTPDAAGIHNANKPQEREALIVSTAEDKPQTFLTLLRRGDPRDQDRVKIDLPEEYASSRLGIDNFVRLFLTVIAHDPSIVRAEQFLRLLRILAPHLYNASSSARTILQEGIDALGFVLMKTSAKPKANDGTLNEGLTSLSSDVLLENRLLEKSRTAGSIVTMRLDYLALIIAFTRAGGLLTQSAMLRAMELIKTMLKEIPVDVNHGISTFVADFVRTSFLREGQPSYKIIVAFLQELAFLITNHGTVVDFSGALQAISELLDCSTYSNEPAFSRAVVMHICAPALATCEVAATADILLSLPSRLNIVALLAQTVLLRDADVIAEVEKRTPSYDYLAGVVLPLVISLKTEALLEQSAEPWQRKAVGSAWVRLLSFAMTACKTRRPLERSRSQDKHRSNDPKRSPLPAFIMSLQIIKAIVVRAEPELSSRLPGIWPRLSAFLIQALVDGSANFASNVQTISHSPSPSHSPRPSAQLDPFNHTVSGNSTLSPSPQVRSFSHPRIIDYSLWSALELLCLYRNPLVLQMRLFTVEKLVELDHSLRRQQSIYSPSDTHNRRASSSVFAKSRRRLSGAPSPNSPGASPYLSPSQTFPQDASFSSLEVGRQPGYNLLSSPHETQGPKIVHLGPISAISAFGRALSPGRGGKALYAMATTTKIKSMTLVRATYKRIRTVQHCMGYSDALLPMPHGHEMDADEVFTTTWTRKEALDAVLKETRELLEEFEESDQSLEDEGVLVDAPSSPRHD